MASSLSELRTRIADLRADVSFAALAVKLRPRISEVLNWRAQGEVLELARTFVAAKEKMIFQFVSRLLLENYVWESYRKRAGNFCERELQTTSPPQRWPPFTLLYVCTSPTPR